MENPFYGWPLWDDLPVNRRQRLAKSAGYKSWKDMGKKSWDELSTTAKKKVAANMAHRPLETRSERVKKNAREWEIYLPWEHLRIKDMKRWRRVPVGQLWEGKLEEFHYGGGHRGQEEIGKWVWVITEEPMDPDRPRGMNMLKAFLEDKPGQRLDFGNQGSAPFSEGHRESRNREMEYMLDGLAKETFYRLVDIVEFRQTVIKWIVRRTLDSTQPHVGGIETDRKQAVTRALKILDGLGYLR